LEIVDRYVKKWTARSLSQKMCTTLRSKRHNTASLSALPPHLGCDHMMTLRGKMLVCTRNSNQVHKLQPMLPSPLHAMVAATSVIVPLQCEYFALQGLSYLLNSIQKIQKNYNPGLQLFGIVLTMFDKRSSLCTQVAEDVRQHLKNKVFQTVIPRNVKVSEAPSHGKPVLVYDVNCLGSQAYMSLAKEILDKSKVVL
ncbi:MAG: ParA family protein, partial [Pseudomonadota bacterium]|nr:ParA family protein [Pseudomonadota bacterium]